jgi:hypothetical protein
MHCRIELLSDSLHLAQATRDTIDRYQDVTWKAGTDAAGVLARATVKGHGLISERRWTPGRYEEWLAHMLTCALLPPLE